MRVLTWFDILLQLDAKIFPLSRVKFNEGRRLHPNGIVTRWKIVDNESDHTNTSIVSVIEMAEAIEPHVVDRDKKMKGDGKEPD